MLGWKNETDREIRGRWSKNQRWEQDHGKSEVPRWGFWTLTSEIIVHSFKGFEKLKIITASRETINRKTKHWKEVTASVFLQLTSKKWGQSLFRAYFSHMQNIHKTKFGFNDRYFIASDSYIKLIYPLPIKDQLNKIIPNQNFKTHNICFNIPSRVEPLNDVV